MPNDCAYRSGHSPARTAGRCTDRAQLRNQEPVRLSAIARRRFTLDSLPAGRILFSFDSPVTSAEAPRSPVRYDKVELTYPGVANLTAVDFFGIPFRLFVRFLSPQLSPSSFPSFAPYVSFDDRTAGDDPGRVLRHAI